MATASNLKVIFDRWERVWHEGEYDLIPLCMAQDRVRPGISVNGA